MKTISFLFLTSIYLIAFAQKPMLCARIEGLWHFYDTNGKEMFEAHAARAAMPQGWVNGLVSVLQVSSAELDSNQNINPIYKRVLLDTKGKVVLEPKIQDAYRILTPIDASGYAALQNNDTGEMMLCDKNGEKVLLPTNAALPTYKGEGMMEFITKEDSAAEETNPFKTLYDVKQKKSILRAKWEFLGDFRGGLALFQDNHNLLGVMNRKGDIIIPNKYRSPIEDDFSFMTEMEHEYFIFMDSLEQFHLFNRNGKPIIKQVFVQMPIIKNGFISVWDEEKEWHIIDGKGNIIAPQLWKNNQNMEGFNEIGMAAITQEENYAVISAKGDILVPFSLGYKYAVNSPTTIFLSKDEQNWDIFNVKGKIISKLKADAISPFGQFHYAQMTVGTQNALISNEGEIIIPLGNYEFSTICDDFFETKEVISDNILYKYWNTSGKMVLKNPIQDMGADWIIPVQPGALYYVPF